MRYGGETPHTLEGVHERVEHIRKYHLLPPGMEIVPYYDRGELVELTTHTVLENLLVGMILVAVVLFLFLGHTRAALITALNIPLALLIAFIGMVATGTPANLISLGAVDFGIVVDSHRHHDGEHLPPPRAARTRHDAGTHPVWRARGRRADDVLDAHHRRRVLAALHDDGRLGRHLLADGAHLRVRDRRGDLHGAHAYPRPREQVRVGLRRGEGEPHHAGPSQGVCPRLRPRDEVPEGRALALA